MLASCAMLDVTKYVKHIIFSNKHQHFKVTESFKYNQLTSEIVEVNKLFNSEITWVAAEHIIFIVDFNLITHIAIEWDKIIVNTHEFEIANFEIVNKICEKLKLDKRFKKCLKKIEY